ncbi:MAG TPA: mechanosensitive ion channel domain-containing protein, partial [Candidatus Nanoarchaeia archaeon]|nr:mechanosensitive ion channel domain-containing protein [Candidatus Nanoarchaeia archaeon]
FFIGVLLLLVGIIIGRVAGTLVQKFLHSVGLNSLVARGTKAKAPIEQIVSYFVKGIIYAAFVLMALNTLSLTTPALTIIAIALLIVVGLSIFLGIKDVIPNTIAGLRLHKRLKKGDRISFERITGEITELNLTDTLLKTNSGDTLCIPNVRLLRNTVIKKSRAQKD